MRLTTGEDEMSNQFRKWLESEYDLETLKEVSEHGCASGCISGLIYYSETTAIYSRFRDDIWEILQETAEMMGYDDVIQLVSADKKKEFITPSYFENHLVWFATEIVAGDLMRQSE